MISFSLGFDGNDADNHELDLYDAAQAILGFQRSLAITVHFVLNGKVITQSPSLKNARIISVPPEEGSWKITAMILSIPIGLYNLSTAPKDTPLGHLMYSAYDYVVSESLGFHVDYEKTLGHQYKKMKEEGENELPIIDQSQFDSAIEKCESAIREMHRPIVKSETAEIANIYYRSDSGESEIEHILDFRTYEYMIETIEDEDETKIKGKVSSYNINTFKGRIFYLDECRPIPFEVGEFSRDPIKIGKITNSLRTNAVNRFSDDADIVCVVVKNRSKTGRLKSYFVVDVL